MKILRQEPARKIHNAGPSFIYEDNKKLELLQNEKNLNLFLNTQAVDVQIKGIKSSQSSGKILNLEKSTYLKDNCFQIVPEMEKSVF